MIRNFLFGFVIAIVLLTVPPISISFSRWLEKWWIPSQLLRGMSLVQGAHESIIVTECCRLGIFEEIAKQSNCGYFHCDCSATVSSLSDRLGASTSILSALLAVLVELGLVLQQSDAHCLTATAQRFLIGDESLCGIGIAGNHEEVLWRLGSLHSSALRSSETSSKGFLRDRIEISGDEGEKQLWRAFALSTKTFSNRIAHRVSNAIARSIPPLRALCVFDVGCGSGEYLRVFLESVRIPATGVYVDLPEVLEETTRFHQLWAQTNPSHHFMFEPASLLDDSLERVLALGPSNALKVLLLNSVLQHLGDEQIRSVVERIEGSLVANCDPSGRCGYIVVTELVQKDPSLTGWFDQFHEILPMTAVFNVVLKAITTSGGVRTASEYLSLIENRGVSLVSTTRLFPMPAIAFVFEVRSTDSLT